MKNILLTGGTGFIGKNISESFLADIYQIYRPTRAELNLLSDESVDAYFSDKTFDCVLHTAAKPSHRNAKDFSNLFMDNLHIFENLARHKDKYSKFINFGSGAIYDNSKPITSAKETDIFKRMGSTEHSFAKYVIGQRIAALPNFIDLNIFGIFGKYEDYAIRFISNAICKSLCGLPITLRQNRRFSYLYINDIYPILKNIIETDCAYKSYNIVPNEVVELKKIAENIATCCGLDSEIIVANEGFGMDYYADNSRLMKEFPQTKFTFSTDAISELIAYYKQNLSQIDKHLLTFDK